MSEAQPAANIQLPGRLGIDSAQELFALLAPHVHAPAAVTLDATQVAAVHASALQILWAFIRARRTAGGATRWLNASEPLRTSAARCGLAQDLGLASAVN